jgi:signal transduction histidine kinase
MQMAASLLRERVAGPLDAKQERLLEIIRLDSEKLLRLIHQILDLSKLRSGMLRLELGRTDLRQIVEHAAQELRPLAEEKKITLTVALPDPPPRLVCDEDRMQQVLANLLSNAVKFTPAGGRVHLTGREEDETIAITVTDTGIGIPSSQLPHVFDRYHQAHAGKGGTGLGLAIVKGFVEAHGGRVWVESREGEGSQFHVAIPREGKPA